MTALSDAVHLVHNGRVVHGTVRSRLPACVEGMSWYEPGLVPQEADTLAAVVAVATRCVPWVRVYVGPRLWSAAATAAAGDYDCRASLRHLPGGRTEYEHRGRACWDDGVVLASASCRLPEALSTLQHEVWHEVERNVLAAGDVAAVDRAAARGVRRPGEYLDSSVERRARLYESWASASDEGWRPASVMGWPVRRVDRVCAYVYSGRLALDVARGRTVRPRVGPVLLSCRLVCAAASHPAAACLAPVVLAVLFCWRRLAA